MSEAQTLDDFIRERKSPCLVGIKELNSRYHSEEPPLVSVSSSEQGDEQTEDKRGCLSDDVLLHKIGESQMSVDDVPEPQDTASRPVQRSQNGSSGVQINASLRGHQSRKESVESICRNSTNLTLNDLGPRSSHMSSNPSPPFRRQSLSPPTKKQKYDTVPPPFNADTSPGKEQEDHDGDNNASAYTNTNSRSPVFQQFAVDRRHIPTDATLAALQVASPARSVGSPGSVQTLPSLTTALGGDSLSPLSASSPHLSRTSSAHFGPPLATVTSLPSVLSAAMSPPNYGPGSNLASYITSRGRANSTSTPSDLTSASTPALSWSSSHSPGASLPTPYSTSSPHNHPQQLPSISHLSSFAPPARSITDPEHHHASQPANMLSPASSTTTTNDHNANNTTNTNTSHSTSQQQQQQYTCPHPNCSSPPFATQYLLNSHMNVHSEARPHFCPIMSCPRGPGGQGFKRKNEMIRHGLVHTSPGYTCPFCPGSGPQQHRYPRPDNLQRHVRVHHREVGRDDQRLREVLGQRPTGGASVEGLEILSNNDGGGRLGGGSDGDGAGNSRGRRRRVG